MYVNTINKQLYVDEENLKENTEYLKVYPMLDANEEGRWRWSKETMRQNLERGMVEIKEVDGQVVLYEKIYEPEEEATKLYSTWIDDVDNTTGTALLKSIVGANMFDYPKPLDFIKKIIKMSGSKNGIILDFFAGSGTTAQAVIELNREDGGNRKFILCTNNENKICTAVTYPRVKAVINGYVCKNKNVNILYSKKLTLNNIGKVNEYFEHIENIKESNTYDNYNIKFKDNILQLVTNIEKEETVSGIPANLKYFKCEWTPRKPEEYLLSNALCLHVKEMIELKYAIEIDNVKNVVILNKDDLKKTVLKDTIYRKIEHIWVNQNIVFNLKELRLLDAKGFELIPKEFFGEELREVAE